MSSKIYIMGLGAGAVDSLTLQAYRLLKMGYPVFLRTERHPVVDMLREDGIEFTSFDWIYDEAESFEVVYSEIVERLLEDVQAASTPVIYAVPGHPMVAERSVKLLREKATSVGIELEMVSSSSFLDDMFSSLSIDPNDGFLLLDGLALDDVMLDNRMHIIITQVYSQEIASEVKLILMDYYPNDTPITVIRAAGVKGQECIWEVPLFEIDRIKEIDHLTALYIPKGSELSQFKSFGKLVEIVRRLRGPGGCPWDQEQTHESIRSYLVEETYEVLEAIENGDMSNLAEELGDLLLHVVMHAQIAKDEGEFSIYQVIESISEKMVRRHPHVFGGDTVGNVDQVLSNWEEIKKQEKGNKEPFHQVEESTKSILDGIPKGLPMLMYAYKQQKKAAKVGFDWDETAQVWDKVNEEIEELKEAASMESRSEELGDLLYAVVNLARFMGVEPEEALQKTCRKFEKRFRFIEQQLKEKGLTFAEVNLEWMENHWKKAKNV